jgi:diaminohydroxyphosphoribosylaminopyrimidine deaminase/5-amino-6-(5-phosphoribosylamino)uracil reductase
MANRSGKREAGVTQELHWMLLALALAQRGRGRVEPNPMVGCVLVRDGWVVGKGYHRRFGGPHAEVLALRQAATKARGSTAYVTLEPCCHLGKTPPCDRALIAAGVREVVASMRDPNPLVNGRGLAGLRRAGVRVRVGLAEQQAKDLNAPYLKLVTQHRPWVILKWAQSLDGKIAAADGSSQWITGPPARAEAHRLRGRVDAVVVGIGTVLADDPLLTCRAPGRPKRTAARVILDSQLRLPVRNKLVRTAKRAPVIVVTGRDSLRQRQRYAEQLTAAGCAIWAVRAQRGTLDLGELLDAMGRRQMTNVLVEGGGKVLGAFWDQDLADEAYVFVAPRLIGGHTAPGPLAGIGPTSLDAATPVSLAGSRSLGEDRLYHLHIMAKTQRP